MNNTLAWSRDGWVPTSSLSIALDDIGFLQGVVIVDRLRTVNSLPFDVALHVQRLVRNCQSIGIVLPEDLDFAELIFQCAVLNRDCFADEDFSIASLVTPGRQSGSDGPTIIVHPTRLDWTRLSSFYRIGQPLLIGSPRNVPSECWSPQIKTRSRLHYYLADLQTQTGNDESRSPSAKDSFRGSVLLDTQNNLTDTSIANLVFVEAEQLIVAPAENVLLGTTLQRTLRLAQSADIEIVREPISVARAADASEILLCGSGGFLWPASCLETSSRFGTLDFSQPASRPMYVRLSALWSELLGMDYTSQPARFIYC